MDFSSFVQLLVLGIVRGSMYALMGVGLSMIFGIMEIVNFAHGELFMLGGYIMYFVARMLGLPWPLGIIAAGAGLLMVGMAIERGLIAPLRRRAGSDWLLDSFVLTIGLMIIFQNLALLLFGSVQRGITNLVNGSLVLGDVYLLYDNIVIIAVAFAAGAGLWWFIKYTRLGWAIRATSQHTEAAQTLGIHVHQMYTLAFGIGSALAGIAGALLITLFPANPYAGIQPVLKSFVVVILGSLGNIKGAIVAGLFLGLVEAYSMFFLRGGWQNVIVFALVIIILIFKPYGFFSPVGERP